ncbi:class I SAM-dependent methyltransferase [Colwellia sp. PAMC 21821]|uniref:class I SAM-dependent methyltransferase n=1 Tax=Colwellia sp. PAMC 21821 TaxID=1816219 RepID=UPI0009BD710C|nr:class I SAM-dependent methyltransferase [Colwellia sp. PAMC 21821]ARD43919.1 methyltransferase [Colwellia sp. PAMC 21821]
MIEFIQPCDFSESQRLFHGRGHAYPELSHVNIDWFEPVILISLYQEVEPSWLAEQVVQLITLTDKCQSIQVQYRCRKFAPCELLWGQEIANLTAKEHGLKYHISLGKAQNSGLFLDMRNGREWVKKRSENKRVLNLFSYTCAFSVAALAGNASKVVNIDMSKSALTKGRENHRLNHQDLSKVIFEGVDIFKSYGRLKKHGPYQLLVSDPPSFQKGSVDIERDYKKIIRRLPDLMSDNGDVLLCLNSPDLNIEFLMAEVTRECPDCVFQYQLNAPEVFKEAHVGKGLKCLYFIYKPRV